MLKIKNDECGIRSVVEDDHAYCRKIRVGTKVVVSELCSQQLSPGKQSLPRTQENFSGIVRTMTLRSLESGVLSEGICRSPEENEDIKVISMNDILCEKKGKRSNVTKIVEPKTHKKRIITTTDKWNFTIDELDPIQQLEYVRQIDSYSEGRHRSPDKYEIPCKFIKQQIQQKLGGYKYQDAKKNKYDELSFIQHHQVLQLMIQCENRCFYCKEHTHVLYENVREPKQWTLERIYNHIGHNETNVVIACLQCNLRRRTMNYQRYVLTKQMNIIKKI